MEGRRAGKRRANRRDSTANHKENRTLRPIEVRSKSKDSKMSDWRTFCVDSSFIAALERKRKLVAGKFKVLL